MREVDTTVEASTRVFQVSRRGFLRTAALAGGGLLLSSSAFAKAVLVAEGEATEVALNAWLRIAPDGIVTIIISQAEIGQGISTTMPALIAEELGADWKRVKFENSPTDPAYRNQRINWQFTGNSESTTSFFNLMRQMGAAAREMLISAASSRWKVPAEECDTENSKVIHRRSGRSVGFGALATAASKLPVPKTPKLRDRKEWKLIGKAIPRVDVPAKVKGSAVFGIDFQAPGMVYAAVKQSPVFGGKVKSFNAAAIQGMPGVIGACEIPNGVAVVADSYWRASSALRKLPVEFEEGANAQISSESLMQQYRAAMDRKDWLLVHAVGDRDALHHDYPNTPLEKEPAGKETNPASHEILPTVFSAEYESQFLAHATMEPMNCTVKVSADGIDVWAPTQGQEMTQLVLSGAFQLPKEKVRVNRTYAGGGFGRRLVADFALHAALLSKQTGKPVKVIWSREEDMQHDIYRPATLHKITAGIDGHGRLKAVSHQLVSPSILQYVYPDAVTDKYDPSCLEGLLETHYKIPNIRVDFYLLKVGVPTSVLRTTGYGPNNFAMESFVDELALRKGQDPYEYRRELLGDDKRAVAVLDAVAEHSRWKEPLPKGHFRGMAFTEAFRTVLAHVVELSVDEQKRVKVHRVTCVADPGIPLDPEITRNSMEGMPAVEVHLIDSGTLPLGGTGEVGPVTVIPAITNAIFAATGERCRSLPLKRHGFSMA